ncbi:site-specific integrase [Nitratidesulfovibrio sp.]|uniref:site-specific integrase n=1 Tax=Nitratidesulfovibrio sp. TaxID=2802297 RepID=UPI00334298EC
MKKLSEEDAKQLANQWLAQELERTRRERLSRNKPLTESQLREQSLGLEEAEAVAQQAYIRCDYGVIAETAEDVLRQRGIAYQAGSIEFNTLCSELLRCSYNFSKIERGRIWGKNLDSSDYSIDISSQEKQSDPAKTISELIQEYIDDKLNSNTWDKRTAYQEGAKLRLFIEVVGDVKACDLRKVHFKMLRDALLRLPKNMTKGKYGKMSVADVLKLEVPQCDRLSTTTVSNYCDKIRSFVRWMAEDRLIVGAEIANCLRVKQDKRDGDFRESFSGDDLKMLFNPNLYVTRKNRKPWKFWVPLIALYTGARIEEICQLYVEDIAIEDGVLCFWFHPDGYDRRIKTKDSTRYVPISQVLIRDFGFDAFVAMMRKKKEERLFPDLTKKDVTSRYGTAPSKWFSLYKRKAGIEDGRHGKKVFHSFRNTMATWCEQHNVPEKLAARLIGHKHDTMTYGRYSDDVRPSVLFFEVVDRLDFDIDVHGLAEARKRIHLW